VSAIEGAQAGSRASPVLRSQTRPSWRKAWVAYLYLLPALVFLFAFSLWPAVDSAYQSLFQNNLLSPVHGFVGLGNYVSLLNAALFWQVLRNTALFSLGTAPFSLVLALAFALLLNRRLLLLGAFRTALFYPTVLPMISAAAIWAFIYVPSYGLMDRALAIVGQPEINWLGSDATALPAVILATIWKQSGYFMIFFLAGLQGLSSDVIEAGELDGASYVQKLRYILLPLLMPTTVFVTTIALIASIQAVDQVYLMTQGGPDNATNLLLYYLYQVAFMNWDIGQASALTVILLLILFIASWLNYRSLDRYTHYES
jgi:sn-glycerol 3-phosphate transport system permease protein